MPNQKFLYLVDVETGVVADNVFTATSTDIRAFGGDKSLFDFIATVVDTKHESTVSRIVNVAKYTFGGTVERFTLTFEKGNLELVSVGVVQADAEVEIPTDEEATA